MDGRIMIENEKAEIIRRIFNEFISGKSMIKIAQELNENGLLNANGKPSWNHGAIGNILGNHKYTGDEYHPAIIMEDAFYEAQKFREERKRMLNHSNNYFVNNTTSTYPFSGKIICGECGAIFKRYTEHHDKNKKSNWKCKRYIVDNRVCCKSAVIDDEELEQAFISVINRVLEETALVYRRPQNPVASVKFSAGKTGMEITRQSNMKQADPSERARLLYQRAAEEYKACTVDDFLYQTKKLKKLLDGLPPVDCFDRGLFLGAIKYVAIYTSETLRFEFINGAIVETTYKSQRQRRR